MQERIHMKPKQEVSRITVEIPMAEHKKLKARAALLGKSMKEIILEMIKISDICLASDHTPNKQTLQSLKNIEAKKNLTETSLEELAKKFGL